MAIQSINTLQNKDNYNSIAEEYLLESLANLGQRYSVKGDSISVGNLFPSKIFDPSFIDEDTLLVVKKNDSNNEYSVYLVSKNEYNDWDLSIPKDGTEILNTNENEFSIDSLYLPNNPGIQYTNIHISSVNGYYDIYGRQDYNVSANKTNFFYLRYRKSDNKLVNGIKIFKKHFSDYVSFNDKYLLVQLKENSSNIYKYDLSLFVSLNTIDSLSDEEIYNFIKTININQGISGSNYLFEQVSLSTSAKILDYDNSIFNPSSELLNIFENTNDQSILKNYIIYSFTDNCVNLYPYLKELYSSSKFGTVDSVYVELLKALYDEIKTEENDLDYIFIPCIKEDGSEFCISYTYNSNNPEIIYFSGKEIEVCFITRDINSTWLNFHLDEYKNTIFAHTGTVDRTSFYFFESSIDQNTGLVDGMQVKKINTLPYIDENGYWIINDRNTGIYARGKSAGNPNIILVETTNTDGGKNILSAAKKDEINKLTWISQIAKIEPLEKINLNSLTFKSKYDYLSVHCSIPTLDVPEIDKEDYLELLDNSLIINISPISCIDYSDSNPYYSKEDVEEIYGEYGVITTLWILNDDKSGFDYIRKQDNSIAAADFNYISNINNLIQHAVKNVESLHPDNYEFSQLVFDSTYITLKNNSSEVNTYIYPNLINKKSEEYGISNYNNDINFTFRANNVLTKNDKLISSISQSGDLKFYITDTENSSNTVTNTLYKYYVDGVSGRYNEYIPNYNVPSLDLSEVLTRNETLLNRLNIVSLDNKGNSYLSYIGTSFEDDKSIFKIGTSNTNINMSSETLISEYDRDSFNKQKTLSIDFDNITLNGDTKISNDLNVDKNIYLSGDIWNKDYIETSTSTVFSNITYYTSIITPVARYIYEVNDNFGNNAGIIELHPNHGEVYTYRGEETAYVEVYEEKTFPEGEEPDYEEGEVEEETPVSVEEETIEVDKIGYFELSDSTTNLDSLLSYSLYNYSLKNNKLYIISTIPEYYKLYNKENNQTSKHNVYFSDGIYLPMLLSQIGLEKFVSKENEQISLSNINITSNMEIIYINNSPIILLSSSTNLYPDKYLYNRVNNTVIDTKIETITNFTYTLFTANPLKITYYIFGSKLHIHIEEICNKNKFTPIKKIKNNYII